LTRKQRILFIFIGMFVGIALTCGLYFGIKQFAPQLIPHVLRFSNALTPEKDRLTGKTGTVDITLVKDLVQEILASEQGKAIIQDLVENQSAQTLDSLFQEIMKSSECRKTLASAVESFLKTPEGKELINKITRDILNP